MQLQQLYLTHLANLHVGRQPAKPPGGASGGYLRIKLGALSLVLKGMTLIVMVKYQLNVMKANDHGEGPSNMRNASMHQYGVTPDLQANLHLHAVTCNYKTV